MSVQSKTLQALLGATMLSTVATLSGAAQAQSGASSGGALMLEEIVVTSRKRAESFQDVPMAVQAFSATDIENAGIERPGDYIALTSNVNLVQTQNQGTSFIVVRGISQARNSEPSVAVVVDGVLQSNPEMFNVEMFDIEHIEILKGPQGALYGRNAIGGAIIVNSKAPAEEFEGSIKAGVDNGFGYRVRAGVSGPLTEDLGYRVGVSYKETDGVIPNTFLNEEADPFRDFSARARLVYQPTENFTADLIGNIILTDSHALFFKITEDVNEVLPVRVNNPGFNNRNSYNTSLKMEYEADFATLTSVSAWNQTSESFAGDSFDFLPIPDSFLAGLLGFPLDLNQMIFVKTKSVSQELRLTSPAEDRLRWVAGTYFISTDRVIALSTRFDTGNGIDPVKRVPTNNPLNLPSSFVSDAQDNFAYAFFGDLVFDATEQWQLEASVRYDNDQRKDTTLTPDAPLCFPDGFTPTSCLPNVPGFPQGFEGEKRQTRFDSIQPKFTVRFQPSDTVTLYSSWGKGFRSGGFNNTGVGAVAFANGIVGVNDIFNAETARTTEVGMKAQLFENRVNFNVTGYHTDAKGSPFFVFLFTNSTQNIGNIDKVKHNGFEIDVTALLAEGLDVHGSVGFDDSKITSFIDPSVIGNEAPLVSRTTANIGAQYRRPTGFMDTEMVLRADYQRLGKTWWEPFNTTVRNPVNLLDLRASLEAESWTLTAWAKNVTDNHYNSEFSPGGFTFDAQPRTYGADISFRF